MRLAQAKAKAKGMPNKTLLSLYTLKDINNEYKQHSTTSEQATTASFSHIQGPMP